MCHGVLDTLKLIVGPRHASRGMLSISSVSCDENNPRYIVTAPGNLNTPLGIWRSTLVAEDGQWVGAEQLQEAAKQL
ncbi:hypothetical protein Bpfe_002388, partial [Biomphalaria pfeifferi]